MDDLSFLPLYFIYHDGWYWKESKDLLTHNPNGDVITIDGTKKFYHRGHCHLFLPSFDLKSKGPTLAYSGEQKYEFEMKDEWGPNSTDPNQIQAIKLLGKPIWYFYVEEYWRRMYIQPYDQIDEECDLPLNQSIEYDVYTFRQWMLMEIEKVNQKENLHGPNSYDGGLEWYHSNNYNYLNYQSYIQVRRRQTAFILWIQDNVNEDLWYQMYGSAFNINNCTYEQIVKYIRPNSSNFTHDFSEEFNAFYKVNAQTYNGYITEDNAMRNFLTLHHVNLNQYNRDKEGNVLVPKEETVGHIGIKYDASKACHSLGPFREGGEFYFFNTVVNRTMPCEYWLDEKKKARQYYLKQKENSDDNNTTGQGIWIFSGDDSHFIWVEDRFIEAKELIDSWGYGEREYNDDVYTYQSNTYYNHRKRNVNGIEQTTRWYSSGPVHNYWNYKYTFQNAKRIKTDEYFYYEDKNNSRNNRWYGTNEQVVHDDLILYNYQDIEHSGEINQEIQGSYDESGWHEISSSSSAQSQTEIPLTIYWSNEQWQGWYEYGEIIKCAYDNKWYKRNWKPVLYNINNPYDKQNMNNSPHWHYKKRQAFPNPSPWLCDDLNEDEENNTSSSYETSSSSSSSSSQDNIHFAIKPNVYNNKQDNRIHLLHWQYCHYYNLIRYYSTGLHHSSEANMALKEILYIYQINNGNNYSTQYLAISYKDRKEELDYYENLDSMKDKQFTKTFIPLTWQTAIDLYVEENGQITSIEEETILFNQFISNLFSSDTNVKMYPFGNYDYNRLNRYSPLYYLDQYVYYATRERDNYTYKIQKKDIDFNKGIYYDEYDDWKPKPLPPPVYHVNDSSFLNKYIKPVNSDNQNEYLTHVTFEEFKTIWEPLSQQEIMELKLEGDMPKRNDTPYPTPTYEQAYGSSSQNLIAGQMEYRLNMLKELKQESLNESMNSSIYSDFFPRYDDKTRAVNAARANMDPPLPPFKLSILEEVDKIPEYDFIDPYRNGKINPIENWKKYFNKREIYTIPNSNLVQGDYKITNDLSSPNNPQVHPRERSYSHEDGARRHYPDDKYISPIIEYQKIIRLNWERLPQKKQDELYLQQHWKNDVVCNWGDGFNTSISIPFKINKEIQSPFSDSSKITKPIGEYCHDCVKEENKMRYHIEWYDSLEQIRKYDFPNYINIINDFQLQYLPQGTQDNIITDTTIDDNGNEIETEINVTYLNSLYQQDFNNYQKTLDLRKQTYRNPETGIEKTWEELLNEYWIKIDKENNFSNTPIVRNRDCYGKETKENSFVSLKSGKKIWRAPTTYFLPTIDKVATIDNGNGDITYGYMDSNGQIRKGGKVVEWNDPYKKNDGKWVEQCLGAVIKVKCVQILQDGLGYRWKQEINDTALVSKSKIKGMDYE